MQTDADSGESSKMFSETYQNTQWKIQEFTLMSKLNDQTCSFPSKTSLHSHWTSPQTSSQKDSSVAMSPEIPRAAVWAVDRQRSRSAAGRRVQPVSWRRFVQSNHRIWGEIGNKITWIKCIVKCRYDMNSYVCDIWNTLPDRLRRSEVLEIFLTVKDAYKNR